jgi:hypothetical protein
MTMRAAEHLTIGLRTPKEFSVTTNRGLLAPTLRVSCSDRQVDEGRAILARLGPEYEYDLDVDGHN